MNKDLLKKLGCLSDEDPYNIFVPTGSYALNKVISGRYDGGVPVGGITQFGGESSTAKTVFVTNILSQAQKLGYYCIFEDGEDSYNAEFAEINGIDPETLIYNRPKTLEGCFNGIHQKIDQIREVDPDTPIVIGLDSIPVLPIMAELEYKGENEKKRKDEDKVNIPPPTMGAWRAKAIGNELRLMYGRLRDDKVALVVVNQKRSKIGVMFGNPDTNAAGGRSLEYYLAVDMVCKSNKTSDKLKNEKGKAIGIKGVIENKKNKVSIPFQDCEFELIFNQGLNPTYGLKDMLIEDGILDDSKQGFLQCDGVQFRKAELPELIANKKLPTVNKILGL